MGRQHEQNSKGDLYPQRQVTHETETKRYLWQTDMVGQFPKCFIHDGWTALYCQDQTETSLLDISSALVEPAAVHRALERCRPDIVPKHYHIIDPTENKERYRKPGFQGGFAPIVRVRYFFDSHPEYLDLAENFRLHYNLYEKFRADGMARRDLFEISTTGKGTLVARITHSCVSVRTLYLDRFLESTGLCLALYITSQRFSHLTLDSVTRAYRSKTKSDRATNWILQVDGYPYEEKFKSSSAFCGKQILYPSGARKPVRPRPKTGWPRTRPANISATTLSDKKLERLHEHFPVGTHTRWQSVFVDRLDSQREIILTSALVKPSESLKILEDDAIWSPYVVGHRENMTSAKTQFGEDECEVLKIRDGLFPLVMCRQYARDTLDHSEVIEEFRLFYDLVLAPSRQTLQAFDKSGNPIDVVRFCGSTVEIRRKHLCEFLRMADYHLVVFLGSVRPIREDDDLALVTPRLIDVPGVYSKWIRAKTCEDSRGRFMLLREKAVVYPPNTSKCAASRVEKRELSFILGLDEFGREIEGTSSYWARKDGNPNAKIYFLGAVLDKYYRNRKNYRVRWAYINCQRRWSLDIFNYGNYVGVRHKHLIRLPVEEQHHWRSYNVSPPDVSELGELQGTSPIDGFLTRYNSLNNEWAKAFKWPLFRGLVKKDRHIPGRLTMQITVEGDFDDHVLNLTKLLVEKLNLQGKTSVVKRVNLEKRRKESGVRSDPNRGKQVKGQKGLEARIRIFLESCGHEDPGWIAKFMDQLWRLRSDGSAHPKKPDYGEIFPEMYLDMQKDPQEVFNDLVEDAIVVLSSLENLLPVRKHYAGM